MVGAVRRRRKRGGPERHAGEVGADHPPPKDIPVERNGTVQVAHVQDQVPEFLYFHRRPPARSSSISANAALFPAVPVAYCCTLAGGVRPG